ncbi:DUF4652 domain-containing protein [Clostridium sp. MT-14]|jgi:hypothetical protein|uniref:DUF4652 domain-containing protein n=1 Tax=Clostridium aromativorans TaxID=2836848 RepID=A0ABS8N683_9CLOT|nr:MULTISPECIES: DUF4652 domain-containing protein [Clostridium]KAA8680590.1 DUF4652 domain-containing protein [Clostridium sp. HV4-5-A1G]MCC9295313.1 DUF4652 domain-containing protein [Clostridium aromativorans]
MKIKKFGYLICILSVILAMGFTGCSDSKNNSDSTKNVSKNNSTGSEKTNSNSTSNENREVEKPKNSIESNTVAKNSEGIKFSKKELSSDTKINFNTPWKSSEDGSYSACIEGKGSSALEEGQGRIIVKNGQKIYSFQIEGNTAISPKYLEWADSENIFVIIGSSHGTMSKGGDLYMLNVGRNEVVLLIKTPSKKQQIISVQKSGSNVNLKVNVYDDDAYNKSHVEDWVINSFNTELNGEMEVKNSDGKVVYKINE